MFLDLDSIIYLDVVVDRYITKIREFGWKRLKLGIGKSIKENEEYFQYDLAEYLYDQGVNTIIENKSGVDRLDLISTDHNHSIIEVKLFKDINTLIDVLQGLAQTFKYVNSYNKSLGYYVIYVSSPNYFIDIVKTFSMGDTVLKIKTVDVTGISGRNDTRERIELSYKELTNFLTDKEVTKKHLNDVLITDLLKINKVGPNRALKIMKEKTMIRNLTEFKNKMGFSENIIEEIKKNVIF